MISQSLYFELCQNSRMFCSEESEMRSFLVPYVFVIHCPSGRGFYLDRNYRHIIDVSGCQEPERVVQFCTGIPQALYFDFGTGINISSWALAEKSKEFTTYWLY